ncbi:MAG: glutamine-hydrolyzing GMP synthase [Deltaproteobacteria bacterium]|nr:glutamine-hydrolyzing GMP synthase [Candidatus Zymogenaceae bacterium]
MNTDIHQEKVVILDFGSQYTQLIARRIREQHVYCEIHAYNIGIERLKELSPKAIVLSGGPSSVYDKNAPIINADIFSLGIPILGICYGMQLIAHLMGGKVVPLETREYGRDVVYILPQEYYDDIKDKEKTEDNYKSKPQKVDIGNKSIFLAPGKLYSGLSDREKLDVWMSHGDSIIEPPEGFVITAASGYAVTASFENIDAGVYGVQFHPEVSHTPQGSEILHNFLFDVAGLHGLWTMRSFIDTEVARVKEQVGNDHVICALSGGVDSSVVAALLFRAIGENLTCIFVDNGLLKKGETERVKKVFKGHFGMDLHVVDAEDQFLSRLSGIVDPEKKRKIIGNLFIEIFEEEAAVIPGVKYLAQGTLYPDVIESVSFKGPSATIKSHHNVGGLPDVMNLILIEPLKELFKDEVRVLGNELNLPTEIIGRHPFPGPGLAVRILGEVTKKNCDLLREADVIVENEIKSADLYDEIWQAFAVLLPVKTVGVMGDERTYDNVVALRIVNSLDGMTADWVRLPYDVLARIASRIINEVKGVNRVVYDVSTKPPSTIEWE